MSISSSSGVSLGVADALRSVVPDRLRKAIRRQRRRVWFGSLRRLTPLSRAFGLDRGTPVDRHYIERFLAEHAAHIRGRVLEVGDDTYTRRFGGDRVIQSDVLHAKPGNPAATFVDDLAVGSTLPGESFDCVICTQTLPFIYDVKAAIATLHRLLKPGGSALVTVPGISQICRYDMDQWGDYWRFTSMALRRVLEESFQPSDIEIESHGNVLAAIAFLHGLSLEELQDEELNAQDRDYELIIAARARKAARRE